MSLKILFCGTPEFAVPSLLALIHSEHEIIGVLTQPDRPSGRGRQLTPSPTKTLAIHHDLPVYQPENLRDLSQQQLLKNLNPDLIAVVAYGLILPKAVLNLAPYGAINVHPSLLPRWRGATPIQTVILQGEEKTGVSIIQLTPRMDAGPILFQSIFPLDSSFTSGHLHECLAQQGAHDLLITLELLIKGDVKAIPQDEQLATYTQKISKEDAHIQWQEPADLIARKIRAYNPWPVAFTYFQGKMLRIWQAQAIPDSIRQPPGSIVNIENQGIDIATGAGVLRLQTVQLSGGRQISVADFIRGQGQHLHLGIYLC